jgi:hypothetical protein
LLRLARVLPQAAQWFEGYLTTFQAHAFGPGLTATLRRDSRFTAYHAAAGGGQTFAVRDPMTAVAMDAELQRLLAGIAAATGDVQRRWRVLRIAYVVRNSMSHLGDDSLAAYQDRAFLRQLIQHVLLANSMLPQLFNDRSP